MDLYHIWCDLKPGVGDLEFAEKLGGYMSHLKQQGMIEGWRLARRKLGLAPAGLGEFHVVIETRDLAQLDRAFQLVATRRGEVETVHHGVNSLVRNAVFGLYRDFPDPVRQRGEERF
ncbi:MAG TPA: DUF6614 family protein [Rhodopila sp.]|nr:DUF6614 family protein [Rhodopila sp.]